MRAFATEHDRHARAIRPTRTRDTRKARYDRRTRADLRELGDRRLRFHDGGRRGDLRRGGGGGCGVFGPRQHAHRRPRRRRRRGGSGCFRRRQRGRRLRRGGGRHRRAPREERRCRRRGRECRSDRSDGTTARGSGGAETRRSRAHKRTLRHHPSTNFAGITHRPTLDTADVRWIDPPQNTQLPLRSSDQIARSEIYAKYMRRTKSLGPRAKWAAAARPWSLDANTPSTIRGFCETRAPQSHALSPMCVTHARGPSNRSW